MGGMKTPGALVVARIPSTSVPVCVVKGVRETPCATPSETPCVEATPCGGEAPCVSEPPGMSETPCASGVVASVPECVLPGTPCVKGAPQGEETTCAREAARVCEPPRVSKTPRVSAPACVSSVVCVYEARVSERPCVRTACVRSLYTREMSVAMREHAAASPGVRVNANLVEYSLGVVTRRSVWREWRRRLRLWRDQCRVSGSSCN